MAGRGPTGGAPGNPPFRDRSPANPCDRVLRSHLSSVRIRATSDLEVGSQLVVDVEVVGGKQSLVCKRRDNEAIVGTVLSRGAATLVRCIGDGYTYVATITELDYGLVEVLIRSRG